MRFYIFNTFRIVKFGCSNTHFSNFHIKNTFVTAGVGPMQRILISTYKNNNIIADHQKREKKAPSSSFRFYLSPIDSSPTLFFNFHAHTLAHAEIREKKTFRYCYCLLLCAFQPHTLNILDEVWILVETGRFWETGVNLTFILWSILWVFLFVEFARLWHVFLKKCPGRNRERFCLVWWAFLKIHRS